MSSVMTMARKELRATFLSPVAHIFLAVFWAAVFVTFFTVERFFAQGLASMAPLFSWLPVLLILLVPALTMRQWSDEQRTGTFEVLITLPVPTSELVLGKFVGTMILVAGALAGTLTLPLMVSQLGTVDWGVVFAGYLASLLVAATYASIGLCLSAVTDNQLVALMLSIVVCGVLFLVGSDAIAGVLGNDWAEVARALGTGSRFHYIERGLVSLRDVAYFLSLTAFFLVLNAHYIESKRADRDSAAGRARRGARIIAMLLVGANAVAANVWLYPLQQLRLDLTTSGRYGLADSTKRILGELQEPLTISPYISAETHPLLAPLVPQIKEALREFEIAGGQRVKLDPVVDPRSDAQLQEELDQQYGVKSVPFRVQSRMEDKVVNSYFHLVVKYGDEYVVLSFDDLIEVHASESNVDVRLKNLEYDLTRAIKKVSQGFQSLEAAFSGMGPDVKVKLTAYVTPATLPEEYKEVPERVRKVAGELAGKSGGHFVFEEKNPDEDPAIKQTLAQYGLKPMAADLFGEQSFYLHLLVQSGDRIERVFPREGTSEADIKAMIEAALKRATPGFLKTVGLLTKKPDDAQNPGMPPQFQPPREPPQYRALEQTFSAEYTFKRVQGEDGYIPDDIDVLIVANPGKLDEKQQFAIDQYLMRGGKVVALAGAYTINVDRSGMKAEKADASLLDLLKTWGVQVDEAFVMDPQNARFPVPVREQRGMFVMERIELMAYPFFPDVRQDGFKEGHVALSGLPSAALTWVSPLKVTASGEGVETETLIETSKGSWRGTSTELQPDFQKFPEQGFGAPADATKGKQPVAVTVRGKLQSAFKDKPSPLFQAKGDAKPEGEQKADATGRTLKESLPDARLVVVGSSEFASDLVGQLGQQIGGGAYRGNMMLVRNLVDWSMEDTDLLQIRSAGAFAWTLRAPTADEWSFSTWEKVIYGVALAIQAGLAAMAVTRRRRVAPLPIREEARA